MPTSSQIEIELLEVTGVKPATKPNQAYFNRLIEAVEGLEDDQWEAMSRPAQNWINAGITRRDASKDIEDFPDRVEEEEVQEAEPEEAEADEAEAEPEEEATEPEEDEQEIRVAKKPVTKKTGVKRKVSAAPPPKASAKRLAAKPTATKKKAAAAPKRAAAPKDVGLKLQIKELMLKDFDMSADDLQSKLAKTGTKPSKFTIAAVRSEFRQTMRLLKEKGFLSSKAPV